MPRKKRPTTGPVVAPRTVSTTWYMLPSEEQPNAIPVANTPKKILANYYKYFLLLKIMA
jgi:hypothetical protein